MNSKKVRNLIFTLHRYLGLALGLIAIIIGLTGSLLVFHTEIDNFDQSHQSGTIIPKREQLPIEVVLNTVKKAYANQPNTTIQRYYPPPKPDRSIKVILKTKEFDWLPIYVNPYTGVILNPNSKPSSIQKIFLDIIYPLHYTLLSGDIGTKFVGIVGLLFTILSITGIILWPGWRKLIAGFKIKLDAHPKRANFDIHKVAGVITATFLVFTFFTGFCWNFSEFVNPIIYALTFSKPQPDFVSVPISGQSPLGLKDQLKIAQAALPNASLNLIGFPSKPEETFWFNFNLGDVSLDQYSGKVLQVSTIATASLGDRILNSFNDLHYGTFWGLPSRIFYMFVGFAPLILFITGFVMWKHRYRSYRIKSPTEFIKPPVLR
ncbi:MAG: PepSY-associated TM helix domain-containing protein [Nostoc sp.]|uniref:PepSY-associated TM helix domain-containing protein n=1 Tax=Nostoc sp. TaxID=1180 RepID=UPI002FF4C979